MFKRLFHIVASLTGLLVFSPLLAEIALPRQLFAAILERIGRLAMQPAVCRSG